MTILAAIDGEHVSDNVVETASEIATAFNEKLVVLHVMPRDQFEQVSERRSSQESVTYPIETKGRLAVSPSVDDGSDEAYHVDAAASDAASVARRIVEETIGEDANVTTRGRVGDPTDEIRKEVERVDARYLVIGGRRRSPVGKAIFGSTTQSVLLNTDRPVVTCIQED